MQPIALPGFRRERRARDSKLFAMRDQRASVARLRSIKAALLLGLAMGYPQRSLRSSATLALRNEIDESESQQCYVLVA